MSDTPPAAPPAQLHRRRFLAAMLLAPLLDVRSGMAADTVTTIPTWLDAVSGEQAAVLRFGTAYLGAFPEDKDVARLLAHIEASMTVQLDGKAVPPCTADRAALLQQAVRSEFLRGDFVRVEGWSLSRTEARIYAAVTLLVQAAQ